MTTWHYHPATDHYTFTIDECQAIIRQTPAQTWRAEIVTEGVSQAYESFQRLDDAQAWCLPLLEELDAAELCSKG